MSAKLPTVSTSIDHVLVPPMSAKLHTVSTSIDHVLVPPMSAILHLCNFIHRHNCIFDVHSHLTDKPRVCLRVLVFFLKKK